jgi:hypothetical protein
VRADETLRADAGWKPHIQPMTNWRMTILYLIPIVAVPILLIFGAYLLVTSTRPADVPLRPIEPAYTRTQ